MTEALPTHHMYQAGQSPWLDNISRELLRSGELKRMIQKIGLKGVTSNPAIFQKAIGKEGGGYGTDIRKFLKQGKSTLDIYDALTIADIRETCDLFLPTYKETQGEHGFVSLEVLPTLAYDEQKTISEAKRLYKAVNRPNVMIKIPATAEGVTAVRELIAEGININITLMFSLKHYQDVAEAYISGLEEYSKKGGAINKVHSVSSVFVSRIDTLIDKKLDDKIQEVVDLEKIAYFENLKGKAAVANSKLIYQEFKKIFGSDRFKKLQDKGAKVQKVLWGSTSVKNPAYPDLLYVDTLIGENTVNTMPQATLDAVLDHGEIEPGTVEESLSECEVVVDDLKTIGMDLLKVGQVLQTQGVQAFVEAFDVLMKSLEAHYEKKQKKPTLAKFKITSITSALQKDAEKWLSKRRSENFLTRFFEKDPGIWKKEANHQAVISNRLGWLDVHGWVQGKLYELDQLVLDVRKDKIKDIVLLGMGGSSLAPEVMSLICNRKGPKVGFTIVDTTDPASILSLESKLNLKATLFIVASKSGGTIETLSQFEYFYSRVEKKYGKSGSVEQVGQHFIAITDQGSGLQSLAKEKAFRKTFINPTDIGGRFSAVSLFGMVPAALMGIDVRSLLRSAQTLYDSARSQSQLQKSPCFLLGALLGKLAQDDKNKLTLFTTKKLASFSCWLEQLIAESTGKEGEGIVPIEGESPVPISNYGEDRVFMILKLRGESSAALDKVARDLKKAKFTVLEMEWPSPEAIGEAFLFWEIVTAIAGAVLGINPFDEPNVKESKDITKRIIKEFEASGKLSAPKGLVKTKKEFQGFFEKVGSQNYIAMLAYIERNPVTVRALNRVRTALQKAYKVPVLVGFGPRYLHSIGQLYKGGPREGFFLELLKKDGKDAKLPNQKYSLGQLKQAQALGDFEAIASKGIPVVAYDLGKSAASGISKLEKMIPSSKKRK